MDLTKLKRWIPVLIWCGIIFFLSNQPNLPGPVDQNWDFIFKKTGHICAYGALFALTYRAFEKNTKHRVWMTFLVCTLYALSDEYHQSFIPGRTPMLRDVGIDIIGMSLMWFFSVRLATSQSVHDFQTRARRALSIH